MARNQAVIGLGLSSDIADGVALRLGYDGRFSGNSTDQSIQACLALQAD